MQLEICLLLNDQCHMKNDADVSRIKLIMLILLEIWHVFCLQIVLSFVSRQSETKLGSSVCLALIQSRVWGG